MKPKKYFTGRSVFFLFFTGWLAFIPFKNVAADGFWNSVGAREAGMNGASVALHDFWNAQNNQAGIADFKSLSVGIAYENRFSVNTMGLRSFAFILPVRWGVTGLSINYFGYSLYHEMKIGVTYARSFGPHFRAGVQFDYLQTGLGEGYGHFHNLTFEIGLQADLTPNLCIGAWVFNPVSMKFNSYQTEHIPVVYRLGLAYNFSKKLLVTVEAEKNTDVNTVLIRAGMEYVFKERYAFRIGLGTQQEIFSMGFGLYWKHLQLDLAARMHASLGFSPQVSLEYKF